MSKQIITLQQFKAQLRAQIRSMFWNLNAHRGRWTLINSEMGTGKTTLIAKELAKSGLRFLWLAGNHRNLAEIETIIRETVRLPEDKLADTFCHLTGIKIYVEEDEKNCRKTKEVLAHLEKTGWDIRRVVCRDCKRYIARKCAYWNNRRRIGTTRMVIAPYGYLHVKGVLRSLLKDRDVVVFDEDFTDAFFWKTEAKLPHIKRLRWSFSQLTGHPDFAVREHARLIIPHLDQLEDRFRRVYEQRVAAHRMSAEDPEEATKQLADSFVPFQLQIPPPISWKAHRTITEPQLLSRRTFYRLYGARKSQAEVGINTEESTFFYYAAPSLPSEPMYLALDFTGDAERMQKLLERGQKVARAAEYPTEVAVWGKDLQINWAEKTGSRIIQIVDSSNSKFSLPNRPRRIRSLLQAIAKRHRGGNISVISYKGWRDKLPIDEILGEQTKYAHFYHLRGTNEIQEDAVLVILGTPNLNPKDVWQKARDYFGDPSLPDALGETIKDRIQKSDEVTRTIRTVYTVNELVQAVGRSRYLRQKRTVYVLSGEPLDDYMGPIEKLSEEEFFAQTGGIPRTNVEEMLMEKAKTLLRNRGRFTVQALAASVGMSYEATRKHMSSLEALMELSCSKEQGQAGRPVHVYRKKPRPSHRNN